LLARELRRQRCVAVLCQEYESPRFDICALLSRHTNVPLFGVYQGRARPARRLETHIRGLTLSTCEGLIIGAQREIDRVSRTYSFPPHRIAPIGNPVDTRLWCPADSVEAREALGISPEARVAVWHGRTAILHKGLDILLDAWGSVCNTLNPSDLHLLLVGGGDGATEVRRLIAARGYDNVLLSDTFVNNVATLRSYLNAGDVYVLSSRWEGYPVAVLEAMACGLPVVATDVTGVRDALLCGDGPPAGSVVSVEDAAGLGRSMIRFLESPALCAEAGRAGRRRVVEHFGIEAVGWQIRNFILAGT
jgi:starch synthase